MTEPLRDDEPPPPYEELLEEQSLVITRQQVIDVAVAAACQVAPRDFFRPHRCRRLHWLTHPVRTPTQIRVAPAALHAAAWATSDRAAEWRVAAAVQQRLVTVPRLRSALEHLPRLRR